MTLLLPLISIICIWVEKLGIEFEEKTTSQQAEYEAKIAELKKQTEKPADDADKRQQPSNATVAKYLHSPHHPSHADKGKWIVAANHETFFTCEPDALLKKIHHHPHGRRGTNKTL